jgi:hypothetical protein
VKQKNKVANKEKYTNSDRQETSEEAFRCYGRVLVLPGVALADEVIPNTATRAGP